MDKNQKSKIISEKIGLSLFIFIIRRGLSFIEDTELLENLEVDRNDKLKMDHLLDEAFIMFLYFFIFLL